MDKLRVLDLFSGIGGFSLGLERTGGFETVAFCEIDRFCQRVLHRHWPGTVIFNDIKELQYDEPVDLICGGDPCQGHSIVGKRAGKKDARYLFPEMLRIVKYSKPRYVLRENVIGNISNGVLDEVHECLEALDYTVWTFVIPAFAVGARHERYRTWTLAYTFGNGFQGRQADAAKRCFQSRIQQLAGLLQPCTWPTLSTARNDGNDDGVSRKVDRNKGLGNAVVPHIPQAFGYIILEMERFYVEYAAQKIRKQ